MLARIRKSMQERDQGFTLIELLVVMIIIGILAAIAIPVFLSQRQKAVDTAARADLTSIADQVATHFVDQSTTPTVDATGGTYMFDPDGTGPATEYSIGPVSVDGTVAVEVVPASGTAPWNVVMTYDGGTEGEGATLTYDANTGLGDPEPAGTE